MDLGWIWCPVRNPVLAKTRDRKLALLGPSGHILNAFSYLHWNPLAESLLGNLLAPALETVKNKQNNETFDPKNAHVCAHI